MEYLFYQWDIQRLEKIIREYDDKGNTYSLEHIVDVYTKLCLKYSLFVFMEELIVQYQCYG